MNKEGNTKTEGWKGGRLRENFVLQPSNLPTFQPSFIPRLSKLFLLIIVSLLVVSYTPKVTPINEGLTNFNKTFSLPGGSYPFGIKTVVIDAGHGGKDPGCLGAKYYEKNAALGIALKLGKYIEDNIKDVKVVYTRKTDIFIDLDERANIANRNKADLFICIHANASEKKDAHGSETYVMAPHKSNANLNVAKRENAAILMEKNYSKKYAGFDPNSETGYILLHMQQNAYLKQSLNFAAKVQKQIREKVGTVDKGVQQAGFLVLWRTAMPSVLIETEFLTNPESEKLLSSEKGQDAFARSIFLAFRQYKDEVEGKLAKYEDEMENALPYLSPKDSIGGKEIKTVKDSIPIIKDQTPDLPDKPEIKIKDSSANSTKLPPVQKDSVKINPKKDSVIAKKDDPQISTENIIYKVQFMSAGQRIPLLSDKFKGLKDVGEYQDGATYKYTAGEFKTIEEAKAYRNEMIVKGHKDCFVVKFKVGKRLKN